MFRARHNSGVPFTMTMLDIDKPMEAIEEWQAWYRSSNHVEQKAEPIDPKALWMQKAQEHFADTLAEYQYELSGKDLYKAFYKAAYENMDGAKKEYEKAKELIDMLRYHDLGQD